MKKKTGLTAAFNDTTHSFLLVQVNAAEMKVKAISETGNVIDEVNIPCAITAKTMTRYNHAA
jgi:hypothetical protein